MGDPETEKIFDDNLKLFAASLQPTNEVIRSGEHLIRLVMCNLRQKGNYRIESYQLAELYEYGVKVVGSQSYLIYGSFGIDDTKPKPSPPGPLQGVNLKTMEASIVVYVNLTSTTILDVLTNWERILMSFSEQVLGERWIFIRKLKSMVSLESSDGFEFHFIPIPATRGTQFNISFNILIPQYLIFKNIGDSELCKNGKVSEKSIITPVPVTYYVSSFVTLCNFWAKSAKFNQKSDHPFEEHMKPGIFELMIELIATIAATIEAPIPIIKKGSLYSHTYMLFLCMLREMTDLNFSFTIMAKSTTPAQLLSSTSPNIRNQVYKIHPEEVMEYQNYARSEYTDTYQTHFMFLYEIRRAEVPRVYPWAKIFGPLELRRKGITAEELLYHNKIGQDQMATTTSSKQLVQLSPPKYPVVAYLRTRTTPPKTFLVRKYPETDLVIRNHMSENQLVFMNLLDVVKQYVVTGVHATAASIVSFDNKTVEEKLVDVRKACGTIVQKRLGCEVIIEGDEFTWKKHDFTFGIYFLVPYRCYGDDEGKVVKVGKMPCLIQISFDWIPKPSLSSSLPT